MPAEVVSTMKLWKVKKKKLVSCPYELFNIELLLVQKNSNIHQCLTCGPIHNAASTGWQCTGTTPRTKESSHTHTVLVSANMRQCYLKTKTGTPLTSEVTFCSQADTQFKALKHWYNLTELFLPLTVCMITGKLLYSYLDKGHPTWPISWVTIGVKVGHRKYINWEALKLAF